MGTVSKTIADDIIAGKYADDTEVVKIVKYENAFGGESYGVIDKYMPLNYYAASPYIINPVTYWEKKA